jgi:hypothetical protein
MGSYFKPLRRKVGIVALVLACVFTAGWVRSRYYVDWRYLQFGDRFCLLRSDRGGFSCNWTTKPSPSVALFGTQPLQQMTILATGPAPRDAFFIYYAASAIPLTLLSAWLLLSKPRTPVPRFQEIATANSQ